MTQSLSTLLLIAIIAALTIGPILGYVVAFFAGFTP